MKSGECRSMTKAARLQMQLNLGKKIHAPHPVARIVMAYNAVFSNWRPGASLSAEV